MLTTLVYRDHRFVLHDPPVDALPALRAEPGDEEPRVRQPLAQPRELLRMRRPHDRPQA